MDREQVHRRAMGAQHEKRWVVVLADGRFLLHPCGTVTTDRWEAYGWHYKDDARGRAMETAGSTVERRGPKKD